MHICTIVNVTITQKMANLESYLAQMLLVLGDLLRAKLISLTTKKKVPEDLQSKAFFEF